MGSFSRNQPRVCFAKTRVRLFFSFGRRAIEFDGAPRSAATLVSDLDRIHLFPRWRVPTQIGASLFRRNPSRQATGNPFTRAGIERHADSDQNGARIARARDSAHLHLPKRQHLRAGGRTSGAVGRRSLRRNNLRGTNESYTVLPDLIFVRLKLVFAFNLPPGFARRFGGV